MSANPRCPVAIPHELDFSPADVSVVLGRSRRMVRYWILTKKLYARQDSMGRIRIDRAELIRFCQDYLHCRL